MPYKDPVKQKDYRANNKEKQKEYDAKCLEDQKQNARDSILHGVIIDIRSWDKWCNKIKGGAAKNKRPYSEDFTNDVMFDMMVKGCFYCKQLATTIDRVDSKLEHTPDNCVASCHGCNISKGAADSATFIRKAYYRAREKYFDDIDDIWFVNKQKPLLYHYKRKAEKKRVPFELTKEDFDILIKGDCAYCQRSPTTWFGVDRIIPSKGYVIGNVASCCCDCNTDKFDDDVESMCARNKRIADRVDSGELVVDNREKVFLHKGTQKSSKKVYAHGKIYVSKIDASRALEKSDCYVSKCIKYGWHSDDIFEITDEFYEIYKDS